MSSKMNLRSIFTVLVLIVSLALASCGKEREAKKEEAPLPPGHEKIVESYRKSVEEAKKVVVAKVNGVNISMHDLVNEMNVIGPEFIKQGEKKDPQADEKVRKEALDRLIYRELAVQEAVRQGMRAAPEKIGDELKRFKADLKSEKAYQDKLKNSGFTEEEVRKQLEKNLLIGMITEKEIFDKVKIDPEQVKKTYAKKKASYKGPSGRQMSFEEARPLIEWELMTPAVQKREDAWVEQLKKTAKIEITPGKSAKGIHSVK